MAQAKQIQIILENLEDLIVHDNWTEQTGPFFYVKLQNSPSLGPLRATDLQRFVQQNPLPDTAMVRDAKNTKDWSPIYSHPYFQRRKPALVSNAKEVSSSVNSYYILKNGEPTGPIGLEQFEALVQKKKLISTDMVSIDEGRTWMKLYQVPSFDRRSYSASELPVIPLEQEGKFRKSGALKKIMGQTEALVSLTFNQKKKPTSDVSYPSADTSHEESSSFGKIILALLLLAFGAYYLFKDPATTAKKTKAKQERSVKKATKRKTAPQAKVIKKLPTRKKVAKPKSKPRARAATPPKRKPTSFTSTPAFQDRKKLEDNALIEDDQYYDDGFDAVELDPVRKAVSKETFDPQDRAPADEDTYIEDDIYLDEENLDAGDSEIISVEDVWGDGKKLDENSNPSDPFGDEDAYYD